MFKIFKACKNLSTLTLMLLIYFSSQSHVFASDFTTNFKVDLGKYKGLWYETARTRNKFQDNIVKQGGQKFSECYNSTARYSRKGSDQIRVNNSCFRRSEKAKIIEDKITGLAKVSSGTQGRKLQIAFGSGVAQFFQRVASGGGFDYWIYCLGPINKSGLYDWAVVSGAKKDFLYFLTRSKRVSKAKLNRMKSCAKKEGLPVGQLIYRQR